MQAGEGKKSKQKNKTRIGREVRVAVALILKGNRTLVSRRSPGTFMAGYWEFPGGKCEKGETYRQAVKRELWEELGIEVDDLNLFKRLSHQYAGHPRVRLQFFKCRLNTGKATAKEKQLIRWVEIGSLQQYRFLPADNGVIKALIREASIIGRGNLGKRIKRNENSNKKDAQ